MNTNTWIVAARFHSLAACAARNGGFWVSAGGGTANVVAGELARATGATFEDAHRALDILGREVWGTEEWYQAMAEYNGWPAPWASDPDEMRWDARTIARAACRSVRMAD